jgi:hypothetical protein
MTLFPKRLRRSAALAMLVSTLFVFGLRPSNATTIPFTQDPTTQTSSLSTSFTLPADPSNAAGGIFTFNLTLGADYSVINATPGAYGSFSMELDTLSSPFWSFASLGASPSTAGTTNYGDFTAGVLTPGNITDTSIWTVGILPGDFPVTLTLDGSFFAVCSTTPACAAPAASFSYDFAPNPSLGTTPLPATLPLFASGIGLIGWIGSRKRKAQRVKI